MIRSRRFHIGVVVGLVGAWLLGGRRKRWSIRYTNPAPPGG